MRHLLVALSAMAFFTVAVVAQVPPGQSGQKGQRATAPSQKKMTMDCDQMMAAHQKMLDEVKAMDSRLDDLTQKMNTATGQAKIDATAAVVSELVSQRKTMREHMESMQGKMMQHMGEHIAMGKGLADCPMMKQPM